MDTTTDPAALLCTIGHHQFKLLDLMEELGAVSTSLREAASDTSAGNLKGALVCLGDAVETLNTIETAAANAAATLALALS
jgi:hypothetical protein